MPLVVDDQIIFPCVTEKRGGNNGSSYTKKVLENSWFDNILLKNSCKLSTEQ